MLYDHAFRCAALVLLGLCLAGWGSVPPARAQSRAQAPPLRLVDDDTQVSSISFKFVDHRTFEDRILQQQIVTTEPNFWDRLKRILPFFRAEPHPFHPVDLQKDVVRLRRFYQRNGFLHPDIGYPASQLDTARNTIRIVFRIEEGPPVIIQDVGFYGTDERFAFYQFGEDRRDLWIAFRDRITVHTGDRYTEFDRVRIQDEALAWLKDRGYAFARVDALARVDSTANTADLRFIVDPGPLAYFSQIEVEGNESVQANVITRELPFKPGDRFSNRRLVRGQQEVFSLNLFRLALADVPAEQPRDSTVDVRIRVREARPRFVTGQTGFLRESGFSVEGSWTHRNFLGGARNFTAAAAWNSGIGAFPPQGVEVTRRLRGSLSLRQPYLYSTRLSGIVSPFYLQENDVLVDGWETGLNTTLLYEVLPFRVITLRHTLSYANATAQSLELSAEIPESERDGADLFSKNILALNGTLGKVDDFINPRRGFLVRPFLETAIPFGKAFIAYNKVGSEVTYYRPFNERVSFDGRLFAGRLFLLGDSRYKETAIFNSRGRIESIDLFRLENRFDRTRFYAGGGSDVRGWNSRQLGPVVARALQQDVYFNADGDPVYLDEEGREQDATIVEEPLGGLAKVAANLEMRMPFPGLDSRWSTAAFVDAGQVSEGDFPLKALKVGVGGGFRYETIVGFIRFDIGFKVNPDDDDLVKPDDLYRYQVGADETLDTSFWRRFALHLSIGQAF